MTANLTALGGDTIAERMDTEVALVSTFAHITRSLAAPHLVLASRREGFSRAVAEALSLGVRVVAVINRGVRQIQCRKLVGLLVFASDWQQHAAEIESSSHSGTTSSRTRLLAGSWSVEQTVRFRRMSFCSNATGSYGDVMKVGARPQKSPQWLRLYSDVTPAPCSVVGEPR
jgi:hypothetical protein